MRVTRMGLRVKTIETFFKCRGKIFNTKEHLSTLRGQISQKKDFSKILRKQRLPDNQSSIKLILQ